jgi:hypothetical protein
MQKKPLKIGFADVCTSEFYETILSQRYELTIDNENPDFLFFGDENFGTRNLQYSKDKCIKIFHTGENRRPENYDCHYAMTFDHNPNQWHYRLPGWALVPFFYKKFDFNHIFKAHELKYEKDKFCVFIHRNGSNNIRNAVFHELCKYKKVDSAGPLFNNIGQIISPDYDAKLDFIKSYKFVLSFENSPHPGYVTEKIMDGFYVNSIQIYWGSATVDLDFNENSFINAGKFNTIKDLIDEIIRIDNDDQLYYNIISQTKFKHNIPPSCMIYDNFLNWFDAIVYNKLYVRN